MAVTVAFTPVSVDADSSMEDVVDLRDEPRVASPEDDSWDLGGVPGRLVERRLEIDMGFEGVVVGLADCACAVCADEFGGPVGDNDGGAGREG